MGFGVCGPTWLSVVPIVTYNWASACIFRALVGTLIIWSCRAHGREYWICLEFLTLLYKESHCCWWLSLCLYPETKHIYLFSVTEQQVFKEEEEAIKVDLHEGCGRTKLFWLMALADSKTMKAMVEFREHTGKRELKVKSWRKRESEPCLKCLS